MSKFSASKQQNGDEVIVKLQGSIDEDAAFGASLFEGANKLVLDLEGVSAINSCGIREWIKWMRTMSLGARVVYRKCPKVIVDQINMVAGFLPEEGKVESFYVPYYNEASGNEKTVLFTEGIEFKNGEIFPPAEVKDDNGEVMDMDVIEAKYFKFLKK